MYREYRVRAKDIAPHNMLALRRGETEGILTFTIDFDPAVVSSYLESQEIHALRQMSANFFGRCWRMPSSVS